MHAVRGVMAALIVVLVQGCGASEARDRAQEAVDAYFRSIAAGSIDTALDAYAPEFYRVMPRDRWRAELVELTARTGPVQSYELASWNVTNRVGTNAGTYATLIYSVVYQRATVQETFVVQAPMDDMPLIVGHSIEFQGGWPVADPQGSAET
jgi:hypothetical protein